MDGNVLVRVLLMGRLVWESSVSITKSWSRQATAVVSRGPELYARTVWQSFEGIIWTRVKPSRTFYGHSWRNQCFRKEHKKGAGRR